MKELAPHKHVIELLACITKSGMNVLDCFLHSAVIIAVVLAANIKSPSFQEDLRLLYGERYPRCPCGVYRIQSSHWQCLSTVYISLYSWFLYYSLLFSSTLFYSQRLPGRADSHRYLLRVSSSRIFLFLCHGVLISLTLKICAFLFIRNVPWYCPNFKDFWSAPLQLTSLWTFLPFFTGCPRGWSVSIPFELPCRQRWKTMRYVLDMNLSWWTFFFYRAPVCDYGICTLWRLAWLFAKETRFKRQLLQHRTSPKEKPDIQTADEVCMGDSRWNGIFELCEGKLRLESASCKIQFL